MTRRELLLCLSSSTSSNHYGCEELMSSMHEMKSWRSGLGRVLARLRSYYVGLVVRVCGRR